MGTHDNLGDRMKGYEQVSKTSLMKRTPVAIRLDGKAFHTFTKKFKKPFDYILIKTMQETTKYLCQNIQGCVFGYTQSDEITLILTDYDSFETAAWFDYEVQKLCSVVASMGTLYFNRIFSTYVKEFYEIHDFRDDWTKEDSLLYINGYKVALEKGAMFDARCFNISKEEVCNLVYWRQLDAIRNSILMVGQSNFSHKHLQGMSCNDIKEELRKKVNTINWEDYPIYCQRGTAVIKKDYKWHIDKEMPILKGEDRIYLEQYI